jgi:hypothetical protein
MPPRNNKPIPKNIAQVEQEQITPYLTNLGKPVSETIFDHNRGTDFSMKGDTVKDISIGLEDIDAAVLYYFNEIIKPNVIQDGERRVVRTIYANPERWKSIQQDGFYRDSNNQPIIPAIAFKRDTVEKVRNIGNKLDGNKVHNYQIVGSKYNKRNAYDQFSVLNNRIPSEQYYISTVPDYINVTYNCIIFTNFVEQNNKIVEAVEFASDSYWGDPARFKFRATIDSFNTALTVDNGTDRIAKSTFNIKLYGYIIPNSVNKDLATARSKFYTTSQVVFDLEVVDSAGVITNMDTVQFANRAVTNATNATSFIGGGVNVTNNTTIINSGGGNADLAYLNVNNFATASVITNPTASFTNYNIVNPPAGSSLPTTTKTNFSVYRNGQYIGNEYITSISQVGLNIIVIMDTGSLGYDLEATDTIDLIGKLTGSI